MKLKGGRRRNCKNEAELDRRIKEEKDDSSGD